MPYFRNIVVALDFSRTSDEALHVAREVAATHGACLHVLHVVANVRQTTAMVEASATGLDDIQRQWVREAEARLAGLQPAAAHGSETREVVVGSPIAATIANYAAANQADLVVVGTHGYGPVKRLLLGSVCDQLLRSTSCPVLTVPRGSVPVAAEAIAKATHVGS